MTIPNLPTDNLYKFIALTGIVLLLVSILYPLSKEQELAEEITLLNGSINKFNVEANALSQKTKVIKDKVERLDEVCKCGPSVVTDTLVIRSIVYQGPKEAMELSRQIDSLLAQRSRIVLARSIKSQEIETQRELILDKRKSQSEINEVANTLGPISVLLCVIGFLVWYERTQRLQDNILAAQEKEYSVPEICQSCGCGLSNDPGYSRLTREEQRRKIYCAHCFVDGNFVEPLITIKDMERSIRKRCKELKRSGIETWIRVTRLKRLDRWKVRFWG